MTQSFFALIDHLNAVAPEERPRVEELVWNTFGVEKAILALDMSHFSLSVRRSGILTYLGVIRRMHVLTAPVVRDLRGQVVKHDADNMMAVFPEVRDAVAAAVRINQALRAERVPAGTEAFDVGIGIDYGRFLMIPEENCYGDPVNIAYKLGEDLARPCEILITAAARDRLGEGFPYSLAEQKVSLSGLEFVAYSVRYPLD